MELRGVLRVNGELAVTRTIGNLRLSSAGVLSSEPDVVFVSHGRSAFAQTEGDTNASSDNPSSPRSPRRDSFSTGNEDSGGERAKRSVLGDADGCRTTASASFLVLASDGLWDVVSSQEAVDMVKEVIQGATPSPPPILDSRVGSSTSTATPGSSSMGRRSGGRDDMNEMGTMGDDEGRARNGDIRMRVARTYGVYSVGQAFQVAATALTHEAYVRGSTDNIGVCVVDLRPH